MAVKSLEIKPIAVPAGSAVDFGVEISNVDLEHISEDDFATIRGALYHSHVVVLKNQTGLSPRAQYDLTKKFDPASEYVQTPLMLPLAAVRC